MHQMRISTNYVSPATPKPKRWKSETRKQNSAKAMILKSMYNTISQIRIIDWLRIIIKNAKATNSDESCMSQTEY